MSRSVLLNGSLIVFCLCISSCGRVKPKTDPNRVPTVRVRGQVAVDGALAAGVVVKATPLGDFPEKRERFVDRVRGETTEGGKFALGLYEIGGGIPPGEYALTFFWFQNRDSRSASAEEVEKDSLNGLYATVE